MFGDGEDVADAEGVEEVEGIEEVDDAEPDVVEGDEVGDVDDEVEA